MFIFGIRCVSTVKCNDFINCILIYSDIEIYQVGIFYSSNYCKCSFHCYALFIKTKNKKIITKDNIEQLNHTFKKKITSGDLTLLRDFRSSKTEHFQNCLHMDSRDIEFSWFDKSKSIKNCIVEVTDFCRKEVNCYFAVFSILFY